MEEYYINDYLLKICYRFKDELVERMGGSPLYTSLKTEFFSYNHICPIEDKYIILSLVFNYEHMPFVNALLGGFDLNPKNINFSNPHKHSLKKVNNDHWKFSIKIFLNKDDIRKIKLNTLLHDK